MEHRLPLFGKLKILKAEDLIQYNRLKFAAAFFAKKLPNKFNSFFHVLHSNRRSSGSLKVPSIRKEKHRNMPEYQIASQWNAANKSHTTSNI